MLWALLFGCFYISKVKFYIAVDTFPNRGIKVQFYFSFQLSVEIKENVSPALTIYELPRLLNLSLRLSESLNLSWCSS